MNYHNHRAEPYFTLLKNGQKTVEARIRKGKYRNIKPGDQITVYDNKETDSVETVVKRVTIYKSIKDMLTSESIKELLPDVDSIYQGIRVYRQFYTPEQEKQYGVVAIEVEKRI